MKRLLVLAAALLTLSGCGNKAKAELEQCRQDSEALAAQLRKTQAELDARNREP
jgi:outer membrane murein-binding lipoprotein Lpp